MQNIAKDEILAIDKTIPLTKVMIDKGKLNVSIKKV